MLNNKRKISNIEISQVLTNPVEFYKTEIENYNQLLQQSKNSLAFQITQLESSNENIVSKINEDIVVTSKKLALIQENHIKLEKLQIDRDLLQKNLDKAQIQLNLCEQRAKDLRDTKKHLQEEIKKLYEEACPLIHSKHAYKGELIDIDFYSNYRCVYCNQERPIGDNSEI